MCIVWMLGPQHHSILQIHLYSIVLFANMDRSKLLLQLLRVLFFEASRHRRTVANIYDRTKTGWCTCTLLEWSRKIVLEFSLPEYKWQCVTQKTTQNQNTLVWCLKLLLTNAFASSSKRPLPKLCFSSSNKVFL